MISKDEISKDEYLQNKKDASLKSEYQKGKVVATSGVTPEPDLIVSKLGRLLLDCLEEKGYYLFRKIGIYQKFWKKQMIY